MTSSTHQRLIHLKRNVALALVLMVCACSKNQAPPSLKKSEPSVTSTIERLLPLKDQTISQFQSTVDGGESGTFVLEIARPRPSLAELRISGRVQRLLIEPGRVNHATGGTLLQEPISVGQTFRGSFGQVTITEVDHRLTVPAGTFKDCVVTREETTTPARRATSVYCPEIGLTSLVVEAFGAESQRIENVLTQHGPRFQL